MDDAVGRGWEKGLVVAQVAGDREPAGDDMAVDLVLGVGGKVQD